MTSSRSAIWYLVFENDLVHVLVTLSTTKFDANTVVTKELIKSL